MPYGDPDYFVTAKHVVAGASALKIRLGSDSETTVIDVADVIQHERADLAVVRTAGPRRYLPTDGATL